MRERRICVAEIHVVGEFGNDVGFEPLCKSVPKAPRRDPVLYEPLALVDALRDGRARERRIAEREVSTWLRELLRG